MRKTELGDTSLREEAIGWYHMTIQKMLVVRQQVVHILETFAGICIIWYRTLELKQRPGCSEDWQTDTHVTKNILSSQTMEHREKALENLYAFFVSNGSYKTGQPDKVQNRGLNQLWAVWQWQGTNALQGLNAMKPWNTEISRRPWSRSIMSSENTLPGPSGRHRLQEQKALEACFPQSRNRIPTHIWALPIWTLSLEEPCHILHSLSFWIGRWLELLERKPLLRMSPIYQHAGCQQRWFTRRTEMLTITDFTFHPSLWSRKKICPQRHGHQDLWSNTVKKDTNES